jgi:hypothetical protein
MNEQDTEWLQPLFVIRKEGEPDQYVCDWRTWDSYLLYGAIDAEGMQHAWESWQAQGRPAFSH